MTSSQYDIEHFAVSFPIPNIAHVEINRPDKLNAFHDPMFASLALIFRRLSIDSSVRAIVLSGRGERAFTAGLDVTAAASEGLFAQPGRFPDPARAAFSMRRYIAGVQDAASALEKCEKPVVCAMHGYCYGLAVDLSCAADVRVVAQGAKLCVKEVEIGLAADVATLSRLPKLGVSHSWVKEVCLTARVFGPEEALRVGFVSAVVEGGREGVVGRALEIAKEMARHSPIAVQGTKNILDYSRDHSVEDGLAYTAVWNSVMLQTDDVKKAMRSGLSRSKPTFEKL